jgi:hypothetical protein
MKLLASALPLRRDHVTFGTPCMIVLWGSQTKRYVPFFSLTVYLVVLTAGTPVFLLTPGPVRWKSWMFERSLDGDRVGPPAGVTAVRPRIG